jgi:hypothetical protein
VTGSIRTAATAARAVAGHPSLWWTAVVEARALAPTRWWRRPPFLPLPDPALLDFRMVTAYGDADARPVPEDIVTWLRWCRDWHRRHGG